MAWSRLPLEARETPALALSMLIAEQHSSPSYR